MSKQEIRNKKRQLGIKSIRAYVYENINEYNVYFNIDILENIWLTASIRKTETKSYKVSDPYNNDTGLIMNLIKTDKTYKLELEVESLIYKINCPFKSIKKFSHTKWVAKGQWVQYMIKKDSIIPGSMQELKRG